MLAENAKDSHQQMTEFGRTLVSLMLTRGIEQRRDLQALLNEGGYAISQPRLSYYLNGDRTVDPKFVSYVSALLGLSKEERRRLSWAYAYGQARWSEEEQGILRSMEATEI